VVAEEGACAAAAAAAACLTASASGRTRRPGQKTNRRASFLSLSGPTLERPATQMGVQFYAAPQGGHCRYINGSPARLLLRLHPSCSSSCAAAPVGGCRKGSSRGSSTGPCWWLRRQLLGPAAVCSSCAAGCCRVAALTAGQIEAAPGSCCCSRPTACCCCCCATDSLPRPSPTQPCSSAASCWQPCGCCSHRPSTRPAAAGSSDSSCGSGVDAGARPSASKAGTADAAAPPRGWKLAVGGTDSRTCGFSFAVQLAARAPPSLVGSSNAPGTPAPAATPG